MAFGKLLNQLEETGSTLVVQPDTGVPQQQRFAALYLAAGFKKKTICKRLGISPQRLKVYEKSKLFRVLVAEYSERLISRGLDTAAGRLLADADENVGFLKKVRDGELHDDDAAHLRSRLKASGMLLDKQFPKDHATVGTTARVSEALKKVAHMTCAEVDEPIDVEYTDAVLLDDLIAEKLEEE